MKLNTLCIRCGRKLKDKKSLEREFGPICYKKYLAEQAEIGFAKDQMTIDEFIGIDSKPKLVWGSDDFVSKTIKVTEEYIRPVDQKMDLHKLSECDPMMVRPLLDAGLWVRATDNEVREWMQLAKNDSQAIPQDGQAQKV